MTKAKVYGIRSRRQGALDRLVVKKEQLEKQEKKVPKRIDKEIGILERLSLIFKDQQPENTADVIQYIEAVENDEY